MQTIRFSDRLYSGDALRKTVKAFEALAVIDIDNASTGSVVTIHSSDKRLADEFCNYALALTKAK